MTAATLGLDLGGSSVKWVLLSAADDILGGGTVPTPATGCDDVVRTLAAIATEYGTAAGAIGLGIPGHAVTATGIVRLLPNIHGDWPGHPLGPDLSARTGRPVTVVNDARAHGRAELQMGAAVGRRNVLFATIGSGVGGAVALDGRILTNTVDSVGELGHVVVDPDGLPCGCGALGCLETVASAPALVSAATRAVVLGLSPALQAATGGRLETLTAAMVTRSALEGDAYCTQLVARAGRALGLALGNVCALLALDTVVVGGGAEGAIDLLVPHLRDHLAARRSILPDISVRRAELGAVSGAVGAALCARSSAPNTLTREVPVALDH